MVFSSKLRTDWRIIQYEESNYEFWDRCSWPLIGMLREHINQWASVMPVDNEFLGRIRTKKDTRQFSAGMFELVFFTSCKRAGLPIERIAAGTRRTTDYTLNVDPSRPIFLECTLVANALENHDEQRRRSYIIQIIEDMADFPYHVMVRFEQTGISTISKKIIRNVLQDFVGNESSIVIKELEFVYKDWAFTFHFHPKKQLSDRTLGAISGFTNEVVDNKKTILAALNNKKPSSYQINQSPYVICLAVDDLSSELEEFAIALLGDTHSKKINLNYPSNAFFNNGPEPVNTSVSAVIFCKNIQPTSFTSTQISVWHNPFAKNPIALDLFPFEQHYYKQERHYLHPYTIAGTFDVFETLGVDRELYVEYLQLKYRTTPNEY
ncbi:hypothetical protein [Longitalea luteola]|uniref:hypothetical protein n=1 Tax=Longitalea luteola TaxID=2812563 RepID=UPI001A969F58|nr:hypothetical protein [Longitalea luteola]